MYDAEMRGHLLVGIVLILVSHQQTGANAAAPGGTRLVVMQLSYCDHACVGFDLASAVDRQGIGAGGGDWWGTAGPAAHLFPGLPFALVCSSLQIGADGVVDFRAQGADAGGVFYMRVVSPEGDQVKANVGASESAAKGAPCSADPPAVNPFYGSLRVHG